MKQALQFSFFLLIALVNVGYGQTRISNTEIKVDTVGNPSGNPSLLFDSDPLSGWRDQGGSFPAQAIIDLGNHYKINKLRIRNGNGLVYIVDHLLVEYQDCMGQWKLLLSHPTSSILWSDISTQAYTRYLRITRKTINTKLNEIEVYHDAQLPQLAYNSKQYINPEDDPCFGIRLSMKTPAVPVGLYGSINAEKVYTGGGDNLLQITNSPYIRALCIAVSWKDLYPSSLTQPINTQLIEQFYDELDSIAKTLINRPTLKLFLNPVLESLPKYLIAQQDSMVTGLHMTVNTPAIQYYTNVNANGEREYIPISTNNNYKALLKKTLDDLDAWLHTYDPDGTKIPMFHYVGPSMNSCTMRMQDALAPYFPAQDSSSLPLVDKWTKTDHINAFKEFAGYMVTNKPGFAGRNLVFNYTSQVRKWDATATPPRFKPDFYLTTAEQVAVFDSLRNGRSADLKSAVLSKTESLCVNFKHSVEKNSDCRDCSSSCKSDYSQELAANWMHQFLNRPNDIPYRKIGNDRLFHGWEIWRSFDPMSSADGLRALSNYPFDTLMRNSLYVDKTSNPSVSKYQGTLWVELWKQDSRKEFADRSCLLDGGANGDRLSVAFAEWDKKIRQHAIAVVNQQRTGAGARISTIDDEIITFETAEPQSVQSVYPVPSSDIVNIKGLESASVLEVIDVNGKTMLQEQSESTEHVLNVSTLPQGLYILRIKDQSKSIRQIRIVIGAK